MHEGTLIKESIADERIIDLLHVHKVELWNTGGNWFVDFKAGNIQYIVFKDKILKYRIGNQQEEEYVCEECRKLGISDAEMNWA